MAFLSRFLIALGLWIICEYVAFSLVAQHIGLDGAIIATLATSLAGIFLLRRLGASARQKLVEIVNSRGDVTWLAPERMGAGFAAALGSLLLILPGFLSDLIGLFLLARSGWSWHHAAPSRNFAKPATNPANVVELSPQDWHRLDGGERR